MRDKQKLLTICWFTGFLVMNEVIEWHGIHTGDWCELLLAAASCYILSTFLLNGSII